MADINFEDIQPYVEGQGDSGLTARQKIKRNFERVKSFLLRLVGQISFLQRTKADILDTEEEGVFFTNEKGEVFLKFNSNGLDASEVSDHLKSLLAQDLSEYAKLTDIPEQLEVIKTTEENGIYFTDGQGNVFIKYDNVNGLDVNKVSEHLKSLITEGLIIPSDSPIKDIDEDIVSLVTNENGESAVSWSDEDGFDVNKVSEHFKGLVQQGMPIPSGGTSPIQNISEDIVSLITNENGESAVLWSNQFGFNANKVNYDFVKLIKDRKIKDMEEYSDLGVGMFIHWGIYSTFAGHFTGTNIDGDYVDTDISEYTNGLAEWAYRTLKIPDATYKANESLFTDENWDADAIAKMAYDCGFGHIVITAKHHEGFTLYDSQFANWNISTSGASGKDPLMELKKACEKYGLKFCLYFSQAVDWMAEGGFAQSWKNNGVDPYTEDEHWDYVNMTANILKEMVDRYNPYVIWYDQPAAPEKYAMIFKNTQLKYYPQVIVNWRLMPGFVFGDFATGETIQFQGDREKWKYAEGCFTLDGGSWGYQESADDVAHTMLISHFIGRIILQCKCRNQNALANIGPKGDGSVSEHIKDLFGELSTYVQRYGTFKDTRSPNIHSFPNWGKMLKKGKTLKLYVLDGSTMLRATPSTINVDGIQTKFVKSVRVYDAVDEYSSSNYDIISDETMLIHNIPFHNTQDYIDLGIGMTPSVVDIEFDNDIVAAEYSNILDDNNLVIGALAFDSNKATIYNYSFSEWNRYGFRLGGWGKGNADNPTWVETYFKFDGTSGSYNTSFLLPNGRVTDPAIATAVFTDIKDGTEQSFTFSRVSTTSSTSVYLEKGKTYKLRMMHDGGTDGTATLEFTKMTFSLINQ